jgi:hypothetical protein
MIDNYLNAVGEEHVRQLADRMAQLLRAELPNIDRDFSERAVAASALASAAQRLDGICEFDTRAAKLGGVTAGLVAIGDAWRRWLA